MKIIFNSYIQDWFWQIYDELKRNYDVILPDNYNNKKNKNREVELELLMKCVSENTNIDFIFDFRGNIEKLFKWNNLKVDIPLVIFDTNVRNRPYKAKKSLYAYFWYVEYYAKTLMEKYNKENLIYQGMAANPFIYKPIKINKVNDIGFFGQHYGQRPYWLKIIEKFCRKNEITYDFPKGHGANLPWSYEDINKFYNKTKINISFAPSGSVNLRSFEICMSGNFQLMQYTPAVEEYFEIDKEIICWKNEVDLKKKISYFLENEQEREKIAKNGYIKAIKSHTWSKRFENIMQILEERSSKKKQINNFKISTNNLLSNEENKYYLNKKKNLSKFFDNLIRFIFKKKGYNLKNLTDNLNCFQIWNHRQRETYYIRLNLNQFYYEHILKKIVLVLKILEGNVRIDYKDWEEFKKVFYLIENKDLSQPVIGILTNGKEWLIYDFQERFWLKKIPKRNFLKERANGKRYLLYLIEINIDNFFKKYNIEKFLFIKHYFKKFIRVLFLLDINSLRK